MKRLKWLVSRLGLVVLAGIVAGGIGAGMATAVVSAMNDRPAPDAPSFETVVIEAPELGESRELQVHLPESYSAGDERYPVLMVLDGPSHAGRYSQLTEYLFRLGLGERMIVVGVNNGQAGRTADFTPPGMAVGGTAGRADQFARFLSDLALPEIESRYRTDSHRVLTGHSLGGLFVSWLLIEDEEPFDGWLSFSPSWWVEDEAMLPLLGAWLGDGNSAGEYLFASAGTEEGSAIRGPFAESQTLFDQAPAGLGWQLEFTPGADHGTNPILSAPRALAAYWAWRRDGG